MSRPENEALTVGTSGIGRLFSNVTQGRRERTATASPQMAMPAIKAERAASTLPFT